MWYILFETNYLCELTGRQELRYFMNGVSQVSAFRFYEETPYHIHCRNQREIAAVFARSRVC